MKMYNVSDRYIEYLRKQEPNVYSNKINMRKHTRKYVGGIIQINQYNYFIPMSSPKNSDFKYSGEEPKIRKSIVPIIRVIVKNNLGKDELIATLRVSHMIPVPNSEIELYNINAETDEKYKMMIQKEVLFIRKKRDKIINNAKLLYKQKCNNDKTAGYVIRALDYKKLEKLCDEFEK